MRPHTHPPSQFCLPADHCESSCFLISVSTPACFLMTLQAKVSCLTCSLDLDACEFAGWDGAGRMHAARSGTFVVMEISHSAQLALSPEVGILSKSGNRFSN